MSQTHEAWLAQKEQQSKQKQQKFMDNIAKRLGHPRMTSAPKREFVGAPSFWLDEKWDTDTAITNFTQHFLSVGGHVSKVSSRQEVTTIIAEKITNLSAKKVLLHHIEPLKQLQLEHVVEEEVNIQYWNSDSQKNWKQEAAQADIGIMQAEYAVAYTGSVLVTSSESKGRSVSLLPTVLIVIIPASAIVTRLGEVLTKLDEGGREQLPAGVHFISGPSRSSDIENDLTIGVHGPGVVFAIIVENE